MTRNEAAILEALLYRPGPPAWLAPLEFGGRDGSHHAVTAKRMTPKGWVERRYRGYEPGQTPGRGARGSCAYRITTAGAQALANHRLLEDMAT